MVGGWQARMNQYTLQQLWIKYECYSMVYGMKKVLGTWQIVYFKKGSNKISHPTCSYKVTLTLLPLRRGADGPLESTGAL